MTGFFAAIILVFCGGFLPLFLWRHFSAMKMMGALAMGAGCLIGLVDAVTQLFHSGGTAAGFNYLNALSLSFQIDTRGGGRQTNHGCPLSGGPFRGIPEVSEGLDKLLPVDLFIPGCPPHPLTNLHALLKFFK